MTMTTDSHLRMLTKEEIEILPKCLLAHPLLKNRPNMSLSDRMLLGDDIKRNGMKKPIVIHNSLLIDPDAGKTENNESERRGFVIVEGYKRYMSTRFVAIKNTELPFAEFTGTDEELKDWLRRERDIRSHEDTKTKVIISIEITMPELAANRSWKDHPLYEKTMKGRDDLAAKINGTSRGNIHKGMNIREKLPDLYNIMKRTDITLEEANKFLNPKIWTKEWIERMIEKLSVDRRSGVVELYNQLKRELELIDDKKETSQTKFYDSPVENYKAKGKLIVQMDKIKDESNVEFKNRAKGFAESLSSLANQWGITDVHVITGSIGKTLIDEALNKTFEIEEAMIETYSVDKTKVEPISDEEAANCKVEQIAPDKSIEKKYQQYIGGQTKR